MKNTIMYHDTTILLNKKMTQKETMATLPYSKFLEITGSIDIKDTEINNLRGNLAASNDSINQLQTELTEIKEKYAELNEKKMPSVDTETEMANLRTKIQLLTNANHTLSEYINAVNARSIKNHENLVFSELTSISDIATITRKTERAYYPNCAIAATE